MNFDTVFSALPERQADFGPCFAFSVHKCGSSLMHSMINSVCKKADIPAISVPDLLFNEGFLEVDWQSDPSLLPAFERRLLYFGFRNLPSILRAPEFHLRKRRFVLLVRDPRDALVSQYFSLGKKTGSHARPKKNADNFNKMLESSGNQELDDYVLRAAPNLCNKLKLYREHLDFDLGLLRRYEDIFFDKETFLSEIFDHFGVEVPAGIIAEVAQKHDIRPEREDQTKHIRKGIPGDHAEKLAPETIAQLNDIFREVGAFYDYRL